MSKLLALSIDVTKINKQRLYQGKKGTYLNLMVEIKDEPDQYGNDASAWEGQTKEERQNKTNRNFLGDGKIVWSSNPQAIAERAPESAPESQQPIKDDDDDLPF